MGTNDKITNSGLEQVLTLGGCLREAREAANLTQEAVAAQLRIAESKLQALEEDRYEEVSTETFVRGYIRRYAGLLGLNSEELIADYDRYLERLRAMAEPVVEVRQSNMSIGKSWAMPAVIAGGLIAVWVIAVNLFSSEQYPTGPAATQMQTTVQPVVTDSSDVAKPSNDDNVATDATDAVVTDVDATATKAAETEIASPAMATIDNIEFVFVEECWLEVFDANGKALIAGLQSAGEIVSLDGLAPFRVMLGNVRAALVTFNGETVSINPQGKRKTLRLTVGE